MIRYCAVALAGVVVMGAATCRGGNVLLKEDFDTLAVDGVVGQEGWVDNSKQGSALVVAGESLSTPNHLELSEGGAVHHVMAARDNAEAKFSLEFGFKRKATAAGRNLQLSLRGENGQPLLFLNIRGSGRSLDAGPSGDVLTEHVFAEDLPRGEWFHVKLEWVPSESVTKIKITSEDGVAHLDESFPFCTEIPVRMIVGSTTSTSQEEAWAVDNILIQSKP